MGGDDSGVRYREGFRDSRQTLTVHLATAVHLATTRSVAPNTSPQTGWRTTVEAGRTAYLAAINSFCLTRSTEGSCMLAARIGSMECG